MSYQRVLRLNKNAAQCSLIQRIEICEDRKSANNLWNQAKRLQIHRLNVLHQVGRINLLHALHVIVADGVRIQTLCNLLFDAIKSTSTNKENVASINVNVILIRMFAASLWRNVHHRSFEQLKHSLLHALAAHIARNARVIALAGNFIYLINKDNAAFCTLHIEVSLLQQA